MGTWFYLYSRYLGFHFKIAGLQAHSTIASSDSPVAVMHSSTVFLDFVRNFFDGLIHFRLAVASLQRRLFRHSQSCSSHGPVPCSRCSPAAISDQPRYPVLKDFADARPFAHFFPPSNMLASIFSNAAICAAPASCQPAGGSRRHGRRSSLREFASAICSCAGSFSVFF